MYVVCGDRANYLTVVVVSRRLSSALCDKGHHVSDARTRVLFAKGKVISPVYHGHSGRISVLEVRFIVCCA